MVNPRDLAGERRRRRRVKLLLLRLKADLVLRFKVHKEQLLKSEQLLLQFKFSSDYMLQFNIYGVCYIVNVNRDTVLHFLVQYLRCLLYGKC